MHSRFCYIDICIILCYGVLGRTWLSDHGRKTGVDFFFLNAFDTIMETARVMARKSYYGSEFLHRAATTGAKEGDETRAIKAEVYRGERNHAEFAGDEGIRK